MTHNEYAAGRVGFAVVGGELIFQEMNNCVYSKEWLCEQLGLTESEYQETIRGGLFPNRITLSVGSEYNKVDLNKLSAQALLDIIAKYHEVYDVAPEVIYNGQIPGEIGKEWEPREVINI